MATAHTAPEPQKPWQRRIECFLLEHGVAFSLKHENILISARRPGGFSIVIHGDAKGLIASFGGLLHEPESCDELLHYLGLALLGRSRLCVASRGGRPHTWTLEAHEICWKPVLSSGLGLPWLRWGKPDTITILSNTGAAAPVESCDVVTANPPGSFVPAVR